MIYLPDVINVVYCSSNFFSEVCAVSMTSLFENNRHLKEINVYIIDDGICKENKDRIQQISERY